jgi:hypothetical protein
VKRNNTLSERRSECSEDDPTELDDPRPGRQNDGSGLKLLDEK